MKIRSSQHNKLFLFFFKEIYQSKEQNIIEKQAKDMNRQGDDEKYFTHNFRMQF